MGQTKLGESTARAKRNEVDEFREKYRDLHDDLNKVKHIEGFPIGEDEDIHRLSDPPYYTAYPNPHIKEFVERHGKQYDEKSDSYHKEPFVGDVTEGKNDPIYNAHSYHTKVPYKAVIKFIEHYTKPGDIVFDGFCGTGMIGVACQMSPSGTRHAVLCDLCPIATFLAYNYNTVVNPNDFHTLGRQILDGIEKECGWMFETRHNADQTGRINYTIWSELFLCPYCKSEIRYWDIAVGENGELLHDLAPCPTCDAKLSKTSLDRIHDKTGRPTLVPVRVGYRIGSRRFKKDPDGHDKALLEKINGQEIPYWSPDYRMLFKGEMWGDTWRAGYHAGFAKVSDFYFKRQLWVLAKLKAMTKMAERPMNKRLLFLLTSVAFASTKLYKYRTTGGGQPAGNNLYIPSLIKEQNPIEMLRRKLKAIVNAEREKTFSFRSVIVSTGSASEMPQIPSSTIDYIFVDPPFGANIMYSESNFIWESWLRVFTNKAPEAIINKTQGKSLEDYRNLMLACFKEMFRILKPGRWITVEFHNSRASVWNAIQEALARAGFIIAQVTILDKKQRTFKQVTCPGAVKNDLIINAYKPKESFVKIFLEKAGYDMENLFIEQHLERLPVEGNSERTEQMLYSKMLAYYIRHGYEINMNAKRFYSMLRAHFENRDGYWFLDNQVDIYEERKKRVSLALKQATLFISDERSAIQWLNWLLSDPKGYDEIYPEFVQVLTTTPDKIPELKELLEENFILMDDKYRRPQVLEKEEIEERRNRRLLKEFKGYLEKAGSGRKLDSVRKEAILAGFVLCYKQKRFQDVLTVAKRLPRPIVESSTEIFDLIDVAETKIGQKK